MIFFMFLVLVGDTVTVKDISTQFLRQKLTVEVRNQVFASYADWVGGGVMAMAESKNWRCFKGGFEISEWQFFEIAGFDEEVNISKTFHEETQQLKQKALIWTAAGVILLGVGAMQAGNKKLHELSTAENIMLYGGTGAVCVGLGMHISSLKRLSQKVCPVSFAIEVADDYNSKLKQSLE